MPDGDQYDIRLNVHTLQTDTANLTTNLYQAGPPVYGTGSFFGREDELKSILTRLAGAITQPILLRGARRVGKTSLWRQLKWILDESQDFLARPLRRRSFGFGLFGLYPQVFSPSAPVHQALSSTSFNLYSMISAKNLG